LAEDNIILGACPRIANNMSISLKTHKNN